MSILASFFALAAACTTADTPRQCVTKIVSEKPPAAAAASTTVPLFDNASPARSTLKDFLSVLNSSFDASSLKDDGNALAFAYNVRFVQLQTTFNTPKLLQPIATNVGSTRATELEKSLSNADDYILSAVLHPSNRFLGTEGGPHVRLFNEIVIESLLPPEGADVPLADPATFEASVRTALPETVTKIDTDMTPRRMNQSFFTITPSWQHRNHMAGPDVRSATVEFTIGSQNLADFYRHEGRDCGTSCATAFARFVERTKHAAIAGNLAVSVTRTKTTQLSLPLLLLNPIVKSHQTIYSIAYGRPWVSFITGKEGRIDLRYTFDGQKGTPAASETSSTRATTFAADVAGLDPPRDHRVAAIAYTQNISDRVSIPVSAVWTDRIITLPAAASIISPFPSRNAPLAIRDRRLAIHAAIVYRIPPATTPSRRSCCCS